MGVLQCGKVSRCIFYVCPSRLKSHSAFTVVANPGGAGDVTKSTGNSEAHSPQRRDRSLGGALAFVVYFTIFVLPKMSEFQLQRARVEAIEIAAENASLCEKLHIKRGK